jgi:UvrB/uvrC motif
MRRDLDDAMQGWPYDPEAGQVIAREVKAKDGRTVVQVRVELGLLQFEVGGRPDGTRPHGFATYLDYLRYRAAARGQSPGGKSAPWAMSLDHRAAADREFVQFYHRRVAWLSLQRYDRALLDADHTLALMDFVGRHAGDEEYVSSHERFRGLVIFHRTQAAAALSLEKRKPEEAIDIVREGAEKLGAHHETWAAEHDHAGTPNLSLIEQLHMLENEVRKNFAVDKTLREQLDEAVALEDYERAARLRDQIRERARR